MSLEPAAASNGVVASATAVRRYLILAFAAGGAVDSGQFLAVRQHLLGENPRRAGGILAGIALWSALAASAGADREVGRRTLVLASVVFLANTALLGIHLRSRLASPRIFLGPALATAALGSAAAAYGTGAATD